MKFESHDSILNIILHIIKLPISSSSKKKNQFKLPRLYTKLKIENFISIFLMNLVFSHIVQLIKKYTYWAQLSFKSNTCKQIMFF
jgi:hypothetical protein